MQFKKRVKRQLRSALTSLTTQTSNRLGFDLIERHKLRHPHRLLREALKHFEVDTTLDVGANLGQFAGQLRELGYSRRIVSFEPAPNAYEEASRQAAEDPDWDVVNLALGATDGTLELSVFPQSSLNTLLEINEFGAERYSHATGTVSVQVATLDDLMREQRFGLDSARSIFLKMDTQGFDLEVLKGAKKTLEKVTIIQTEASVVPIYKGMPTYIESMQVLDSLGFAPAAFWPVSRAQGLELVEFDLISVRQQPG
ncbi:MAG: FkbM family methyltransferase [Myxococcales bacterium]|nr:FkbM family methyltransferase [Myxococcales bacterium]